MGSCVLVVLGVSSLYKRFKSTFLFYFCLSLIVFLSWRTVSRNPVWSTRESLFRCVCTCALFDHIYTHIFVCVCPCGNVSFFLPGQVWGLSLTMQKFILILQTISKILDVCKKPFNTINRLWGTNILSHWRCKLICSQTHHHNLTHSQPSTWPCCLSQQSWHPLEHERSWTSFQSSCQEQPSALSRLL